jgi:hypothetical protein
MMEQGARLDYVLIGVPAMVVRLAVAVGGFGVTGFGVTAGFVGQLR